MNKLNQHLRPLVEFDPENKDHRRWYKEFSDTMTWSNCPVRFSVVTDSEEGNTQAIIQRILVQHYLDKEFKTKFTKATNLAVAA